MRITGADCTPYDLRLHDTWRSAAGSIEHRRTWLLRLHTDDGRTGHGECAPLPSHGSESAAVAEATLRQWLRSLSGRTAQSLLADLPAAGQCSTPAARAALECALLDLCSQSENRPLASYLRPGVDCAAVTANAMLGVAIDLAASAVDDALAAGFTVLKLKLGVGDPERELAALEAMAATLPPGIHFRLDANRAWNEETAARLCARLAKLPVESLEEPLADPAPAPLRRIQAALPFPLALDESWHTIDRGAFFSAPPVRRLVLKLAACGGLQPALKIADEARTAGVDCVVTTGVDGACATLAAAHLAAALDNGLAHGLATSTWLANDIGAPPPIVSGRLCLPAQTGLGFFSRTIEGASHAIQRATHEPPTPGM
jgi:o-succinylbenzoate synthase